MKRDFRSLYSDLTWWEMWRRIQRETCTVWEVESSLHSLKEWGLEEEDYAWVGPHAKGLEFIVHGVEVKA